MTCLSNIQLLIPTFILFIPTNYYKINHLGALRKFNPRVQNYQFSYISIFSLLSGNQTIPTKITLQNISLWC